MPVKPKYKVKLGKNNVGGSTIVLVNNNLNRDCEWTFNVLEADSLVEILNEALAFVRNSSRTEWDVMGSYDQFIAQ